MTVEARKIILDGLIFLDKHQEKDGSFLSFSSCDDFKLLQKKKCIFQNTLILSSLCKLDENKFGLVKKIKTNLAKYLQDQKNESGLFNYWDKNEKLSKIHPYPNDLDDTSCALAALHLHDPKLTTGETLAQIVNILTILETKEGGPYRTWAVPNNSDETWKDVDLAVNSNVAYFLSLNDVCLPNLIRFVEKNIEKNSLSSRYYVGSYPIIYFISRFYKGPYKTLLARKLCRTGYNKKNVLDCALTLSSLINIDYGGHHLEKQQKELIEKIKEKSWQVCPFVVELVKNGKRTLAGSSALTCALCLEALAGHDKSPKGKGENGTKKLSSEVNDEIFENLEMSAKKVDQDLKNFFRLSLKKFKDKDKDGQVSLLPCHFLQSLRIPLPSKHRKIVVKLGSANVLGWIAYSIYDDFFDHEGDIIALSVANFCLRELTKIFETALPEKTGFSSFFNEIMNKVDSANCWETTNCRAKIERGFFKIEDIPLYNKAERLSDRSMGHALGPLCLLFLIGHKKDSPEVRNLTAYFKYYIAAKQLNDDMHDWEDDLQKGMLTLPVSKIVLKNNEKQVNINDLDPLRKIYWHETVEELCQTALYYTKRSREYLQKLDSIKDRGYLESLLVPIENAASAALIERKKTIEFLNKLS